MRVSLLLGACQAEHPSPTLPDDRVWQSQHFAYHARAEDAAICGDLLATLEQHFYYLQGKLGFEWPADRRVHYYKFLDEADYVANAPCPRGSGGCSSADNVYAFDTFQQHELVHAYLWHLGSPPTVVSEGAAVALACNLSIAETPSLSLTDATQVQASLADERVYDTGGRLVRYLLDQYGPEAFIRLYSTLAQQASFAEMDQAMRNEFGAGADDIWNATLATHASCPPPFACSRETLPGDGMAVPVMPVCGIPNDNRTFAVSTDGDIAIAAPASTKLGSCDPIPFSQTLASTYAGGALQVGLLSLAAGRYYLDFPSDARNDLAVLEPSQPWAGSDCSSLQPFEVGGDEYQTVAIAVPRGRSAWNVKLRFIEPQRLALSRSSPSLPSLKVVACPSCDFKSSLCQTFELGEAPIGVTWHGDYVLHLDSLSAQHADRIQITRP